MSEVLFKRGKLANLPVETDPNTFYLIEDAKTIQIGGAVLQDTNDVKVELKGIINDKYAATTQKITELEGQMVNTSALTKVEEMIPVSTSQLTNDSGFITVKDLPSDLTAYVTEEELVEKGYTTTSYVDEQMSSKQDVISDLEGIRDGASKGSTAIQPNDIATVATSGSYDDLLNKPTIPDAVTESDVSNWGFTKNTGTYSKPTDGIPQTDLSNEVQALLDKADTALQSIPSEYVTETVLNDKGYLTEVPSEYITESELNNKNYVIKTELDNFVLVDDFTSLAEIVDDIVDDKVDANVLSGYSTTSHTHDDKQDVITDLDSIRTNAALGATALQSIPNEYITESELNAKGYITEHQDLSGKQDKINDLDAIRSGATLGATALQSVPSEYVTETELTAKGYLTEHQDISGKQDVISDIDTIRTNASLGATALQSIPSEYITESELNAKGYLTSIPSEYITETELSNKGYATKAELTGYTTDAEYNTLVTTVNSKANSSALTNYSTTSHTHGDLYYTETEIDSKLNTKQNVISDLEAIRSGAALGATALQSVPTEYVTETELNNKGYATTSSVNSQINTINQTIGVNTAGFTLADRITKLEDGYDAPDARANVLWIGTSIPAGDISFSNNGTTQSITTDLGSNNYPKMIADVLGFNLYNNSRGSSFVCFYPSNEDGTANWAGKDWSEYSSEVWKGYSLSASFAQVDEKFGPNGLNCPEWLVNNFKSYSYESLIIPYIDGTLASCDTVVIDHGYNDRSIIINEASWHPGEGETQFAVGAGRDWLLKLQDPFETTLETETYFQGKWWNDESVSSKKHYISAIIFLVKKIWAVNPKIKIIIGNYFTSKSKVFGAEFGNDRLGEFVHLANSAIASWLRVNCVEVWHHTGLYNRNVGGVNDYQNFCPDGVHPHSDSTGHSNKVIAGVYINALRGTLYK